jgi:hypothetical protein
MKSDWDLARKQADHSADGVGACLQAIASDGSPASRLLHCIVMAEP